MSAPRARLLLNPPSLAGCELLARFRNETLYRDDAGRHLLTIGPDCYELSLEAAQRWAGHREVFGIEFPIGDDLPANIESAYAPVVVAEFPGADETLFMDSQHGLIFKAGDTFTNMTPGEAPEWSDRRGVVIRRDGTKPRSGA